MASIQLQSVRFAYPGGAGLQDVDLSVADGEVVALVGPSGSGKTTLLRTVAGFLAPADGRVRIGPTLVAGPGVFVPPERRHLGMVFQQHAIWPHWTVGRNVDYPLRLAGTGRAARARRVTEVLELVGLPGLERHNPAALSGGQRQRVALARALAPAPGVLLLDEALSALDEPLRARLRVEVKELAGSLGLTVLHVTHDRDEALALADRVVVLDEGRVQQVGTPEELVQRPASPFVARFLSDATVIAGSFTAAGFVADAGGAVVPAGAIGPVLRPGPGQLAVLPDGVDVVPASDGDGVVTSSLYGRDRHQLRIDWSGVRLHAAVSGRQPAAGERVAVSVRRALFYPSVESGPASAGAEAA